MKKAATEYPHSGKEINIRPLSSSHRRFPQTLNLCSVLTGPHQQMALAHRQRCKKTNVWFKHIWLAKKVPLCLMRGAKKQADMKESSSRIFTVVKWKFAQINDFDATNSAGEEHFLLRFQRELIYAAAGHAHVCMSKQVWSLSLICQRCLINFCFILKRTLSCKHIWYCIFSSRAHGNNQKYTPNK